MLILSFIIIAVICSTIAVIYRSLHLYALYHNNNHNKSKLYTKIAIFFRLVTLIFLAISTFLVYNNIIYDNKEHISKFLVLLNLSILLIPIAIIELVISMI